MNDSKTSSFIPHPSSLISERAFEDAIERTLIAGSPGAESGDAEAVRETAPPYDVFGVPGGYRRRMSDDYDRARCMIPRDVLDFVLATSRRYGSGSSSTTAPR